MAHKTPAPDDTNLPRPAVRRVVSLLVALHVFGVFLGPWAMQGSQLSGTFFRVYQPYLEMLGLANGYRFFAPEPGPSHLVRYVVRRRDGSAVYGSFPSREEQWPRLLYHRYFMLSEFLNSLEAPSMPRDRVEAYTRGYAQHLLDRYDGSSVQVYLQRHYVPRMSEVQQGMRLTDKALYEERLLVSYEPDAP